MLKAQSFVKNKHDIELFLLKSKAAVLILNETHVTEDLGDEEIAIGNYNLIRLDSNSRHTGGVICYVMKDVCFQAIDKIFLDLCTWIRILDIKVRNECKF